MQISRNLGHAVGRARAVTVIAGEADETFEADVDTEQILLRAIEQCTRGETISMVELLGELRE
jgi:hypothetical protein